MKRFSFILLLLVFFCTLANAQQAQLHIVNNSLRTLTVKVMKDDGDTTGNKYSEMVIAPNSKDVEYFSGTGNYYLKTKAEKQGAETLYKKGNPFTVTVSGRGYSVLTITYSISESHVKNPMEGASITRSEFENDY